ASTLRPSVSDPKPADVGYLLGRSHGRQVWASVEDSILLIGPPRAGKGMFVAINAILDAPGAVVTTSTRPDNLTATLRARLRRGPVAVFDPQHLA
ncbi:type IV secretory system conjugative DNA transfer family protein, partial [Escherichia coli]